MKRERAKTLKLGGVGKLRNIIQFHGISNTHLARFIHSVTDHCAAPQRAMQDSSTAANTNASVMSPPQVQCQFERAFMKYVWT